jgi:lipoprotein-releasing system ATP-binding protein
MIELRNIHKRFGTLEVLKGIDLTVGEAELVSIVGSSGAGKTTLLQIMGTLDAPSEGDVFIDGERVNSFSEKRLAHLRNTKIGFVFQFHQLLPEFSALENVMIPSLVSGADRKTSEKRAGELLELMGLSERMSHRPNELSGGEKQRVAVARALVNRPTVVLADEPSGSLDTHNKEELHRLFARLRDELHQTFVIVTHDEMLSRQADHVIRLSDGRIV